MSEKNLQAVSYSRHEDKTWNKPANHSWTADNIVCGLDANELVSACMSMPVGFTKTPEGFMLVGLLGVGAGKNLMLDKEGNWRGKYLPYCFRNFPFVVAKNENGEHVLCVDEASGLIGTDPAGNRFFLADGQPAPEVTEIFNVLQEREHWRARTQNICKLFEKHDLIEPWKILIKDGDGQKYFEGLYHIKEKQLLGMDGEALQELHNSGALLVAFSQLLSMQHLATMGKEAELRNAREMLVPVQGSLQGMKDFDDGSGIISFDKLFGG